MGSAAITPTVAASYSCEVFRDAVRFNERNHL